MANPDSLCDSGKLWGGLQLLPLWAGATSTCRGQYIIVQTIKMSFTHNNYSGFAYKLWYYDKYQL